MKARLVLGLASTWQDSNAVSPFAMVALRLVTPPAHRGESEGGGGKEGYELTMIV